ncbi:DUF3060 domain-containing protein [Glaciihabitans arcticus]|uniref:DUF3060 domain-containing protein n=1 Tax=Glaciihabitans arcticus TaxID=2668039 RepID=A0A4Q9GTJ6_9MICO|nr:DUF3060 domain-containing protein [Glaciihabitans arcticus]TBN57494.1 DUF3060 domain-containing protein [Glaciihabitans arcticus]
MKKTPAPLAIAALIAATLSGCAFQLRDPSEVPAGGNTPIEQNEESENPGIAASGACDDRAIVVDQDGARLVLTGHCASVTITATDVAVNIETADSVTISGSEITLLAEEIGDAEVTGMNVAINPDRVESIDLGGEFNTLITKYAGTVTISGDNNIANWDEGAGSATDTGTGNTIVGP